MALVHFVVLKMGPILSLFVDGEQVYVSQSPSIEQLKKSFQIFFPIICSSEAEFVKDETGLRFFINGKEEDIPLNSTTETFEDETFFIEAIGNIKLPIVDSSDKELADMLENGNILPAIKVMSKIGFPLMSEQIRKITKHDF